MTETEYHAFAEWFDILAVTHELKAKPDVRSRMCQEYFDVLRAYPREAVQAAYETLRRRAKRWPKPADWCEALPPQTSASRLPVMMPEEIRDTEAAERLGYEAERFCYCESCRQADATHLVPRFVPQLDRDGHIVQRRHPKRSVPVVLGEWLHGTRLKNWWAARGHFYELLDRVKTMPILSTRIGRVARRH